MHTYRMPWASWALISGTSSIRRDFPLKGRNQRNHREIRTGNHTYPSDASHDWDEIYYNFRIINGWTHMCSVSRGIANANEVTRATKRRERKFIIEKRRLEQLMVYPSHLPSFIVFFSSWERMLIEMAKITKTTQLRDDSSCQQTDYKIVVENWGKRKQLEFVCWGMAEQVWQTSVTLLDECTYGDVLPGRNLISLNCTEMNLVEPKLHDTVFSSGFFMPIFILHMHRPWFSTILLILRALHCRSL